MWVAEVPSALVNACAIMLPRLEAEESMLAATRVAMGNGSLQPDEANRVREQWSTATMEDVPSAVPAPVKPHTEALQFMGFAVRRIPTRRAG